ncbi:EF-hand domain-containing protein [Luteolibacter flavescens]|uniref:EF-hand domain-containing protein n=1 Tax=Luteolibacter flavescens TaxID=1859460 RepID=A0ABT3FLT5_9BACT|nr:EF-hand domain-containing protein [Luteolibacter flavescens]MCW1884309.1 EF-hand domain-containing protein [Luteolibacter flavescens]
MKRLVLLPFLFSACATIDEHTEAAHGRKMMSLLEKFDRFDYNGDGVLTRKEIEQGITEAGAGTTKPDPEELDAMMKHYDTNKDGKITRWEAERVIDLPVPDVH